MPLPDDLPVIERSAVRLVVLDIEGRLLLFHTHDIDYPELGTWWELPGGVIERSRERFYPGQLPALLDAFLDGEEIDEPFELWS